MYLASWKQVCVHCFIDTLVPVVIFSLTYLCLFLGTIQIEVLLDLEWSALMLQWFC